jgi:molybdopterin/thiamine biosynthesis adenylyltransferase
MDQYALSNQELRRYKRQISLAGFGVPGQEKLQKSKVIVIGAGGIGIAALQYLAASGIGELGICDNAIIEEASFQNQVLYRSIDLGKHKAIIVKEYLEALNNFNKYSIYNIFISNENAMNICRGFGIVINATNNEQIGLILDKTCYQLQIPLIHASKYQHECRVSVFNYKKGPGLQDYLRHDSFAGTNITDKSDTASLGVIDGITGNFMALEAIKIISGVGEVLSNKILCIDPINLTVEYKNFQ